MAETDNSILRAETYRLCLSREQETILLDYIKKSYQLCDHFLAEIKYQHNAARNFYGRGVTYFDLCQTLTTVRDAEKYQYLAGISVHILRGALNRLSKSLKKKHDTGAAGAEYWPRYMLTKGGDIHPKRETSLSIEDNVQVRRQDGQHLIVIPSTRGGKPMCIRLSRGKGRAQYLELHDLYPDFVSPRTYTVKQDKATGYWYASVVWRLPASLNPNPVFPHPGTLAGVDVGIVKTVQLSAEADYKTYSIDADRIKAIEKEIARLQARIAWQEKGSKSRAKSMKRLSVLHRKRKRITDNFAHQVSAELAGSFETVAFEDLEIPNMTKSAKGTASKPGKQVKQKSGLNKSILRQGWGQTRLRTRMKAVNVIEVPARNTSRKCPSCGHTHKDNRPTQATFICTSCNHEQNADRNAADNIAALAKELLTSNGGVLQASAA